MKVQRDKKLDVAYIELKKGKVAETVELRRGILIDFDKNGEIIGIEVLSISKLAPLLASTSPKNRSGKSTKAA